MGSTASRVANCRYHPPSRPNKLLIQVPAVRQDDLGNRALVSVNVATLPNARSLVNCFACAPQRLLALRASMFHKRTRSPPSDVLAVAYPKALKLDQPGH
jgi:hypothetical protein